MQIYVYIYIYSNPETLNCQPNQERLDLLRAAILGPFKF